MIRRALGCAHEFDAQQAAASGRWPAALARHVSSCPTCAEVRLVTEAFAGGPGDGAPTVAVDPALLFARAREERRLHAEARISLVATATHILVLLGVLAVTLFFVPMPSSLSWPDSVTWPSISRSLPVDPSGWVYPAGAFVMASIFMLVRWTSQDA